MDRLLSDLRHALRLLRREPLFAAIAVLAVGLGVGANTAVFSLVSAVLLRPLPYGEQERVAIVWNVADPGGTTWLSRQEVTSMRRARSRSDW
jgi:putative ABC transport system permease protein